MRYHNITNGDILNGEGVRVVLWLSGCDHACKGCQNPQTWSPKSGIPFDNQAKSELVNKLSQPYIDGITLSGGDPLSVYNVEEVSDLLMCLKHLFPKKTVWVYTGYRFEDIQHFSALKYIDVLVDGKFDLQNRMKNPSVQWRGDDSQRIIDVQKSLEIGQVVERTDLY